MSIALVIPTYNRADLIGETIRAALAQTRAFAEIVVVDDGSTDHTPAVLREFGSQIRVIRTSNQGVQSARNTGMQATTAALVSLCDSDDLLLPGFAHKAMGWLERHPSVDALYCNFELFDALSVSADKFSGAPAGYFEGAACEDDVWFDIPDLYVRNLSFQPLFQCGATFRRAFIERIGGYNTSFKGVGAEDWELTLRAIAQGRVAAAREPLARVRRHVGNDSANGLHMLDGEVQVLQYALAHHPTARHCQAQILTGIEQRLGLAFHAAYALGDLALAGRYATQLRSKPADWRFGLKHWISRQPTAVAAALWRLTQLGRQTPKR